jgi:hypothetical protein
MQVIPYTGTGLTSADRDGVTITRLRNYVSSPPPQTALNFRSGVENNFVVLFHFIIHFVSTISTTLRSGCSRHNVFKLRSWGSWFEALLGNDYLESGLRCSEIYRRVGLYLPSCCICRRVVCTYSRVRLHLPSCCLYIASCCTYRRVVLYTVVLFIYRRAVCIYRLVVYIYHHVGLYLPPCCLYLPSCRFVSTVVFFVSTLVLIVSIVV